MDALSETLRMVHLAGPSSSKAGSWRPGAASRGAPLATVLSRRPRQLAYGGGPKTCLVCGYLVCDARLARMLLAGLPPLLPDRCGF